LDHRSRRRTYSTPRDVWAPSRAVRRQSNKSVS
jgi:hypothetical protein